ISPGAIFLIISTYAHGMGANFPGQSLMLCGHPTHVASCASHSAGMRKPSAAGLRPKAFEVRFGIIKGGYFAANRRVSDSGRVISEHLHQRWIYVLAVAVQKPLRDPSVSVDPSIAQKRPVAANVFEPLQIDLADQNFLFAGGSLREHNSERVRDK